MPEARVKAQRQRPKQSKTLKLQVQNSPRNRIEARSARQRPKQAWKHESTEVRFEAGSSHGSRDFGFRRYCRS